MRMLRRLTPCGVVLAYHRVAAPSADPQALAVSPSHFAEHLEVLRDLGASLSLRDFVHSCATGSVPRGAVVMTFDDGYADNLTTAEPLLRESGLHATVFVTTGGLEAGRPFWWDELEALILRAPQVPDELTIRLGVCPASWRLGGPPLASRWAVTDGSEEAGLRAQTYLSLSRVCRQLPAAQRREVLDQIAAQVTAPAPTGEHLRLTPAQVRSLAGSPCVEVGAHGVDHVPLAVLEPRDQRRELLLGKETLAEMTGRPVDLLSYPFGARGDITRDVTRLARSTGFAGAVANWTGPACRFTDPFALPRYLVRDWDGEEFARRLREWSSGRQGG